jgi:hypothetical protein
VRFGAAGITPKAMGNEGNEMEMETVRSWFKRLSSFDHRRAERLESPLLIAYYWDGSVPVGHEIRDISSSGFYLVTTERWHPGTVVTMTLQRSDIVHSDVNGDNYISVLSRVVRPGEDGVGFAFVPLETQGSSKKKFSPRSRPVGRKALYRFLEQLNLDQGRATIESNRGNGKEVLLGQGASSVVPGATVMRGLKDESGQSLVLAAFAMTCLMGCVALAADVGLMLRAKRLLQTAADSAAIAGALEINFATMDGTTVATAAKLASQNNGFTDGSNGTTVTVNGPPTGPASGPHVSNTAYVEVIVSQSQPTVFMRAFGRNTMTVSARAVATLGVSQGCVYTLSSSGTGINWNGSGATNVPACSILDDSSVIFGGSGSVTAQSIGVVGSFSKPGSGAINPYPPTVIAAVSDPLAFMTPPDNPGSCHGTPTHPFVVLGSSLVPGCYDGLTISGSSAVTMATGLYYIDGPFSFTGSGAVTGTGVTIYLTHNNGASFAVNGSGALSLSAPTSGTNNGILLYQNPSNTSGMSIGGSGALNLQGIIYAPGSDLTMTGSGGSQFYTAIVTSSLTFNGSGALQDYAVKNPSSPLSAARLVE